MEAHDTQLQDVLVLHTLLTAFTTARSVDRLGATSTTLLTLSNLLQKTLTPTMSMVSMGTLVDIFEHTLQDFLMMSISMVTTIHVPSTRAPIPLASLGWTIIVNLETLAYMKNDCTLMTLCGMVMDVVQATAAVHRLGCRGSVGPSHRK